MIGAMTATSIEIDQTRIKKFSLPKLKVYAYFVKSKSWAIEKNDYYLTHERLHFDIAEIYARKIRKAFDSLNNENITDVAKYKDVYNKYGVQLRYYNKQYDSEVYYSEKRQSEWIQNIHSELDHLKDYEFKTFYQE